MKTIVKLLMVGLAVNAMVRIGSVYLGHYQFVDAVREAVQFRANKSDEELHDRVVVLASQYGIQVADADVTIEAIGPRTSVRGSYSQPVEAIPGVKYVWPFKIDVDAITSLSSAAR